MTGKTQSQFKQPLSCHLHRDVRLNCNAQHAIPHTTFGDGARDMRLISFLMAGLIFLAACAAPPTEPILGADGRPLPKLYKIRPNDTAKLQFRMLDSVNALRGAQGLEPVELNPQLNAAAATHAQDMSLQNRPWHFGSDGSSPIDRLFRVGYEGRLVGENISETYETELETLAAWMEQEDTRRTLLAAEARDLGFAWFQEQNGKIWWTLVMGNPEAEAQIPEANPAATRLVPEDVDDPTLTEEDTTEAEVAE